MSNYVYHGTEIANITKLETRSILHNTKKQVLYLTDNISYALVYIWSKDRTGYAQKYVTCGVKEGKVFYEEQFPNQLEVFYKGVSGYLYYINKTDSILPVEGREYMYYSLTDRNVDNVKYIADVYEELIRYEKLGEITILRFNEQSTERKNQLIDMIASYILEMNMLETDNEQRDFMKRYFKEAWNQAEIRAEK